MSTFIGDELEVSGHWNCAVVAVVGVRRMEVINGMKIFMLSEWMVGGGRRLLLLLGVALCYTTYFLRSRSISVYTHTSFIP